jgi:hypothetical protein
MHWLGITLVKTAGDFIDGTARSSTRSTGATMPALQQAIDPRTPADDDHDDDVPF